MQNHPQFGPSVRLCQEKMTGLCQGVRQAIKVVLAPARLGKWFPLLSGTFESSKRLPKSRSHETIRYTEIEYRSRIRNA